VRIPDRIAEFVHRRWVLPVACALPCAALIFAYAAAARKWQEQAQALRRENLTLELKQLSAALERESADLATATRTLAQNDALADWAQETAGAGRAGARDALKPGLAEESADDAPPLDSRIAAANGIAHLLIMTPALRFSGALVGGHLIERAADAEVSKYAGDAIAAGGAPAAPAWVGGELVAVSPIVARASGAPLGWLAAARSIAPGMLERLRTAAGGTLSGWPASQLAGAPLTADARAWIAAKSRAGVSIRSFDDASAYAVLRDPRGAPVWVLRLSSVAGGMDAAVAAGRSVSAALEIFLALLAVLVTAGALFAVRHYFRHRASIDSRYKAIIDQTNDGIVIVDADRFAIQYCNPSFLAKIGYTAEEAASLTLADIFADGDAPPDGMLARLRNADSHLPLNLQLRCKNDSRVDMEVRCNRLDEDGRDGLAYVTHDVSVRRKAEQQLIDNQQRLDKMAHHDQLTGLPNRHYLTTFLPEAIEEARAASQMLGVVFLDLDRFKHINDTRGHETGDKLLQEVARRLKTCVRESDVVIRMGGDEFVVVLRQVKSYEEVTTGASRINECLNKPIVIDQHPLQTTGSVGVSLFPRDGADMGELLKHSDTAMYQAKDRGRNNVQMFSQIMNRKLKLRVAMEASLRDALRLKQLDVHYQPFVHLVTRKVVGLEALIRWRHPVHGMVPADQFIPVAEETGLIVPMGNFVLHRTLQTMAAWQRQGVKLVPVSLNVAPAQLQRGELQTTISTLLATHGLRPDLLQLEMTERAVFDSTQAKAGESRQDTVVRLRDLGIKIAIDDFGTGYSSLSYLKNWRVDTLKIDRSFVRDLVTDSSDLAIVSAIIAIARHLRIQVIAEGIEAYQQAEILCKLGCTIGQGFLFARPMPADQCLAMMGKSAEGVEEEEEDMLAMFASGRA
jgi:diguanylate cyclase (GGDEF)-like protein/PAS domain S-box-containing protein